jgi:predicted transposase YbfD/YdcC
MNSTKSTEILQGCARNLFDVFSQVKDPREKRGIRYPLAVLLTVITLAKLSGETELRGIAQWARYRAKPLSAVFKLERVQMPHWTTYSRVLRRLDADHLQTVIQTGLKVLGPDRCKHLILDGKTLRGTIPSGHSQGEHLLSLYEPDSRRVLAQVAVGRKENELTAAPRLLDQVTLNGTLISGDAMFAHRDLSQYLVTAGGDYLWTVKENQPHLYQMIERLFTPERPRPGHGSLQTDFRSASTVTKAHGRIEQRTLIASSLLNGYADWPGLQQVFRLERTRHSRSGSLLTQVSYGITSLSSDQASPTDLLAFTRRHWAIENQLHYPRDVSLREDACRLHSSQAQTCMAALNNLVIALLALTRFPSLPDAQRFFCAHLPDALAFFF